ncbi:MAG: DUF2752 domain-containing protein [Planctomycetes bacterium]|nr:DUF2752 domain-containing protein [Planctomycetota bacterium]
MNEPPPYSPVRFRRHRSMLLVAAGVVLLSLVMQVGGEERVSFQGLGKYPLPPLCMSRSLFGVRCPGCGLTRSLICFFHGQWQASWELHRLGWLMAVAIVAQFPYRIAGLWRRIDYPLGQRFPKLFGTALIFLLVTVWLVETICQSGPDT